MAKKKKISEISLEIEKLQQQLLEIKTREEKEKKELVIKIFSPLFLNNEICTFCDNNQKNKQVINFIVSEIEKSLLDIIKKLNNGEINFKEDKSNTEDTIL